MKAACFLFRSIPTTNFKNAGELQHTIQMSPMMLGSLYAVADDDSIIRLLAKILRTVLRPRVPHFRRYGFLNLYSC